MLPLPVGQLMCIDAQQWTMLRYLLSTKQSVQQSKPVPSIPARLGRTSRVLEKRILKYYSNLQCTSFRGLTEGGNALAQADPLNLADNVMLPDELQLLVKQHATRHGILHFPLQHHVVLGSMRQLHAQHQK